MTQETPGMDTVSLNDKRVDIQTYDRYKGRKNVTDRIAILSSTLIRARVHYNDAKKKSYKCLSTPEQQKICCKTSGEPDQKFGLIIFQYLTDEKGDMLTDEKLSGKVKLWVVSDSRYSELSQIHKEFPLLDAGLGQPQFDMLIKCTEEQYQRMTFTPCNSAFWKKKPDWYAAIKQKEEKAKPRLVKAMGNDLTEVEIMELLEVDVGNPMGGANAGGAAGGEIDLGDVLD